MDDLYTPKPDGEPDNGEPEPNDGEGDDQD